MTFRARLTIAAASAVAAAIVVVAVVTYVAVRSSQRGEVDRSLRQIAARTARVPLARAGIDRFDSQAPSDDGRLRLPAPRLGGPQGYLQLVRANGKVELPQGFHARLPVSRATTEVAARRRPAFLSDATVDHTHVRILTAPARSSGAAVQLARPLTEVDGVMRRIAWILAIVSVAGVAVAVGVGLLVTRSALRPVRRLTEAAEHVAATQNLAAHIPEAGRDELSRLGHAFNRMLDALAGSRRAQRQLVADASHELRTPLTSLRANLELLQSGRDLPEADRRKLMDDLVSQSRELSLLVGDLVDLAREGDEPVDEQVVRLDEVVRSAVRRVRPRAPETRFVAEDLQPTEVMGDPAALDRATVNLLDNAVKFSPPGGAVEITVSGGRLEVRDHGPGISDEELPLVFDRFYRASAARNLPGSGLGLAIVRQVAHAHRGSAFAQNAPGGGARLVVTLPTIGNGAGPAAVSDRTADRSMS